HPHVRGVGEAARLRRRGEADEGGADRSGGQGFAAAEREATDPDRGAPSGDVVAVRPAAAAGEVPFAGQSGAGAREGGVRIRSRDRGAEGGAVARDRGGVTPGSRA